MKMECFHKVCDENLGENSSNNNLVKKNSQKANQQ